MTRIRIAVQLQPQHADYSETIILPDYAFTLLEALRSIQEQKPREFKGQLYAAHQLITSATTHKDFSPTLAVSQTYENIRQVVRGLNELNQNLQAQLEVSGELFVSNAVIEGRYLLRTCIVNFRTAVADVDRLLDTIRRVAARMT